MRRRLNSSGINRFFGQFLRHYKVLAIESSCDDSAVCLIDRRPDSVTLIDHMKTALDSSNQGGIIPVDAMAHHLQQIGPLTNELLERNGRPSVDLVCATEGPGMFSSLAAGLQVGKGLAVAWNVPFIGVHHMLGHLLTPRFFTNAQSPSFPFVSLLASGGHTMLVLSKSLTDHRILVNTIDIAVGNALDKCARHLGMHGNMLGKELDLFTKEGEVAELSQDIDVPMPLEKKHNGHSAMHAFAFAHYASLMPKIAAQLGTESLESLPADVRRAIGIKVQDSLFGHIVRKSGLAIRKLVDDGVLERGTKLDFVCAGGVAASSRLRTHLAQMDLPVQLELHFADPKWCTDNALMIGWAGIEMYEHGFATDLTVMPRAKWPLDEFGENAYKKIHGSTSPVIGADQVEQARQAHRQL